MSTAPVSSCHLQEQHYPLVSAVWLSHTQAVSYFLHVLSYRKKLEVQTRQVQSHPEVLVTVGVLTDVVYLSASKSDSMWVQSAITVEIQSENHLVGIVHRTSLGGDPHG